MNNELIKDNFKIILSKEEKKQKLKEYNKKYYEANKYKALQKQYKPIV